MRLGKTMALDLIHTWQIMVDQHQASLEVSYRLQKMSAGLLPLVDRLYLKTPKAQETLQLCAQKTALVENALQTAPEEVFQHLTDLEQVYEELLNRTFEFRVKAG